MTSINKSSNTLPHVSKELVEYLRTKVVTPKYTYGNVIKPEDVAYIYGQQSMYDIVLGLYKRSNNDATVLNTKALRTSGGKPGGDQEESLFGPTEE